MHDETEKIEKIEKTENPSLPVSTAPTENDARLILLYEIGRILASAETMNEAAPQILEAICRSLHFQLGELWCLGKHEDVLRFENDWHFPSPDVEKFLAESRRFEFAKGEDLPGQVWEKGEPVWIENFAAANFPRQPFAAESELRGAFAFPILLGEKTLGVFNFFSRELVQPDELLLEMFVAVGNHIGQFIKREKIESNLRESEESYRIVAETASDAVIKIDENSKILFVNTAVERIFGFTVEEMLGQTLTMIMPEDMRERHLFGVRRYLETGVRNLSWESIEIPALHADGHIFPMEISFGEYNNGDKRFFIGIARDTSERKQTEEKIRESERRLKNIFNQSFQFAALCTPDGVIVDVNEAPLQAAGLKREEIVGKLVWETVWWNRLPEMQKLFREKFVESLGSDETLRGESRHPKADGSMSYSLYAVTALRRDDGSPEFVLVEGVDITERKRAEEDLRESEERFRSMADNISQLAWMADASGWIFWYNRRWFDFTGTTLEEMQGWGWQAVHHPDFVEPVTKHFKESVAAGEEWEDTFPLRSKTGEYCWFLSRAQPIRDADGNIVRWFGTNTDITFTKQAELQLRESEERFSKAFSASPLVLAISSLETGVLVEVNETFVNATGFSRDEAIGKTTLELGLWAKPQERAAEMEIVRQQGQLSNVEYSFRTKNGDEIIGLLAAESIEIGGKPFALTVIQDITTRKRSEEALIKAERKAADDYQALLQRIVPLGQTLGTMRDLISVYRAVFEFVRTSMSCSAFFVSFFDAETNLRRAAYVWGEGEEIDVAAFPPMPITSDGGVNSQAIFGKKTVIMNRYWDQQKNRPHVVLQDNGVDPQSSLVVPMVIKNEVIGTLEVQAHENKAFNPEHAIALEMVANLAAVAIENVRLLEIEASARRVAEDANRAKDEFLSILSHELRTPLNAILGWTRLMKISSFDRERYNQAIETIERNARLQNNLIEDLLDVSRIISGKMRIEAEKIDFVSAARSSLETVRPLAAAKNIALEFDTAENTLPINGDAARLQQIIVNLINNSVKFTPENGSVIVRLLKKRKMARLEIIDTGIGISRDFLPHIFDRFRQADSTTQRHHNGLGLGLTIVRHLTQMHDGEVYAASDGEGKGAVFAVEIPLIKENEAVEFFEIKKTFDKQEQFKDVLRGMKILLVDDDGDGLYPVKLFLENHGAALVCAGSAGEGLKKFAETKFDLILSDIGMPEMDGYRLIEKVRSAKNNSKVPAIALTAYASAEDRRRALTAGFQAHLSKPMDFDELLQIIIKVFGENKNN